MGGKQSTNQDSANTDVNNATAENKIPETPRKSNRPSHEFLTEQEANAAKTTWTELKTTRNLQGMGVKTLLRLFELEPRTKDAFESFRDLPEEDLVTNVLFRSHASRFMKAVEVAMDNLDALDVIIIPNLKQLGRRHKNIPGFRVEYLKAAEIAMEEIWTGELGTSFSGDCQLAWRKIINLITTKVAEGYQEAFAEGDTNVTPSSNAKADPTSDDKQPEPQRHLDEKSGHCDVSAANSVQNNNRVTENSQEKPPENP